MLHHFRKIQYRQVDTLLQIYFTLREMLIDICPSYILGNISNKGILFHVVVKSYNAQIQKKNINLYENTIIDVKIVFKINYSIILRLSKHFFFCYTLNDLL